MIVFVPKTLHIGEATRRTHKPKNDKNQLLKIFSFFFGNQKVKSIIVTEVTVMSPFIMYSSQNPWNFLDMEVIMIKEDVKCLSPFHLKSIRVTLLQ